MSHEGETIQALQLVPPVDESTPAVRSLEQFHAYQRLQQTLDDAMPEQIQLIRGKKFRKKGYWRAVAKGFRITTTIVHEERIEVGDHDWGYLFVVRATNPNGESAEGDGACSASEKGDNATLHNVRSHAHTRAKNRAISDLVGFGEVSAEEAHDDEKPEKPAPPARAGKLDLGSYVPKKARGDEPPHPADADSPLPAWFDERIGIKPHRESRWCEVAQGSEKGRRHSWLCDTLAWAKEQENPGAILKLFIERAPIVIEMIESRG